MVKTDPEHILPELPAFTMGAGFIVRIIASFTRVHGGVPVADNVIVIFPVSPVPGI